MPDYSILEFQQLTFGQLWSLLQWWGSISFGLMALTRFSGRQLNRVIVIALTGLYSLFTLVTVINILMLVTGLLGVRQDLIALNDSGDLSAAGLALLDFRESYAFWNGAIVFICMFATYVGTVSYLVYVFRKEQSSR